MFVPEGGGPMPNYFSGTNCRASGSAQIGEPILHAYLRLNGELVAEYHYGWEPEEPMLMSIALKVMFDSSHWPSASVVDVHFQAWGVMSGPYDAHGYAATWNHARVIFEHPDAAISPDAAPYVYDALAGTNYFRLLTNGGSWDTTAYFASMDGSNVLYCCTHGNQGLHEDGEGEWITADNYLSSRIEAIGQGVHPFNDGAPPVNFFHLPACNCGDDDSFETVFYPYQMAWGGPPLENQAMIAYSCYTKANQHVLIAESFWPRMVYGWTVRMTLNWVQEMLLLEFLLLEAKTNEADEWRPMRPEDVELIGGVNDDGACRIKSVYTGTNVPPIGWYRQL